MEKDTVQCQNIDLCQLLLKAEGEQNYQNKMPEFDWVVAAETTEIGWTSLLDSERTQWLEP